MSKRNKTLETLRGLLAERQQYEQWLVALARKRSDTPEQVYERVHQDYQSRLTTVLDGLQSHTEDLQGSISELSQQLADVTERETIRREAHQEAELRAAVGEFPPEKWGELSREAETELKKFGQERSGVEAQLSELAGILELTQGRTPPAGGGILAAQVQTATVPSNPLVTLEPPPRETPQPSRPAAESTATRAKAFPGDKAEDVAFPAWSPADQSQAKSSPASFQPKSSAGQTRPESEKTLKCQDCGALHFPTEWYCEKCGSELATL